MASTCRAELDCARARRPLAQAVGDVVGDIEMREQRVVLEHHVDRPAVGRHADHGSSPPIRTSPDVGCSKPAIIRREVVLPQPEGPRKVKNEPGGICRSTASTAATAPKRFDTATNSMSGLADLSCKGGSDPVNRRVTLMRGKPCRRRAGLRPRAGGRGRPQVLAPGTSWRRAGGSPTLRPRRPPDRRRQAGGTATGADR